MVFDWFLRPHSSQSCSKSLTHSAASSLVQRIMSNWIERDISAASSPRGSRHDRSWLRNGWAGFIGVVLLLAQRGTTVVAFTTTSPKIPRTVPRTPLQNGAPALPRERERYTTSYTQRSLVVSGRRGIGIGAAVPSTSDTGTAAATSMEDGQDTKTIDGKATAAKIRAELKNVVQEHSQESGGLAPGLAVVLVGDRRDSATYVRMKKKACDEIGVSSFGFDFPESVSQDELMTCVRELNARSDVHGILVQLPLPSHIDEQEVLQAITPFKDVDGLHPDNVAALCTGRTRAGEAVSWALKDLDFHVACTPQGCIELLDRYGVQIAGKRAVVLGRSNIVGIPVSMLLMHRDATVTMTHSKTVDLASVVREADIVVCAAGRPEMVKADWIKPGAAVIDVGINSVDDPTSKKGYRLVGDVDFKAAKEVAGKITPVPGGVGPMTIAMLLRNTVNGAIRAQSHNASASPSPPVPPAASLEGAAAESA